ncbi:MAG: transglycosylase SLT domain-containing protein [Proteobacteria bacterium]|nr:transglycosylase SLT domain-containing protein [Pseudomonadota bacterium]
MKKIAALVIFAGLGPGLFGGGCASLSPPDSSPFREPSPINTVSSDHSPAAKTDLLITAVESVASLPEFTASGSEADPPCLFQETAPLQIVINPKVNQFIEFFQNKQRDHFTLWLERSRRYLPIMEQIFLNEGLPPELAHLALIESGFNPNARSRARAVGPWQFIRYTGKKYGLRINDWVDERRDPIKSTYAAARYLKDLYSLFGCWYLAAAGYNAGEGKISRAIRKSKVRDFWELVSFPYIKRETKDYVPKFMAAILISHEPEDYGFMEIQYLPTLDFDLVSTNSSVDLAQVSDFLNLPLQDLMALNPELLYPFTPPNYPNYQLKVPAGTGASVKEYIAALPREARVSFLQHRVRPRETLSAIAKKYRVKVSAIMNLNGISSSHRLKPGEILLIPLPPWNPRVAKSK